MTAKKGDDRWLGGITPKEARLNDFLSSVLEVSRYPGERTAESQDMREIGSYEGHRVMNHNALSRERQST